MLQLQQALAQPKITSVQSKQAGGIKQGTQSPSINNSLKISPLMGVATPDIYFSASRRKAGGTGIVSTLGPATFSREKIKALMLAGVDIFRLNFSHGKQEEHGEWIDTIRDVNASLVRQGKLDHDVVVMADIQGPKIRVGSLPEEGIELTDGATVYLDKATESSESDVIPTTFPLVVDSLKPGQKILMADGTMELKVTDVKSQSQDRVACEVVRGGKLTSRKGINLPTTHLDMPILSEKDRSDIQYALNKGVDYLAISFVRNEKDMKEVNQYVDQVLPPGKARPKVIAKIEKPEAVVPETLEKITALTDGLMVARGDLGIEMDTVQLPRVQERIIRHAKAQNKEVIVATQMLESMMDSTVPSRAEVADIADAVKDRTDYVMLSGETSVGEYPVEAVKMMNRVINEYQPELSLRGMLSRTINEWGLFLQEFVPWVNLSPWIEKARRFLRLG